MADNGYQLDYKKVHNTLGSPKSNIYGDEVGLYASNLLNKEGNCGWYVGQPINSKVGGSYDLIASGPTYVASTHTYSFEIDIRFGTGPGGDRLINVPQVGRRESYNAQFFIDNNLYDGEIKGPSQLQTTIIPTTGKFTLNNDMVGSDPLSLLGVQPKSIYLYQAVGRPNRIYNIENPAQSYFIENTLMYLFGQGDQSPTQVQKRDFYNTYQSLFIELEPEQTYCFEPFGQTFHIVVFGYNELQNTYFRYYEANTASTPFSQRYYMATTGTTYFKVPSIGVAAVSGTAYNVNKWYFFCFPYSAGTVINQIPYLFKTDIKAVIQDNGLIVKSSDASVIELAHNNISAVLSDAEAFALIDSNPPTVTVSGALKNVSVPSALSDNASFQNGLLYKNYKLCTIFVKDHGDPPKSYKYDHHGYKTTSTNRFGIIRQVAKVGNHKYSLVPRMGEGSYNGLSTVAPFNIISGSEESGYFEPRTAALYKWIIKDPLNNLMVFDCCKAFSSDEGTTYNGVMVGFSVVPKSGSSGKTGKLLNGNCLKKPISQNISSYTAFR